MNSDRTAVYLQILASAAAAALADCSPASVRWNYETGLLLHALGEASEHVFGGLLDSLVFERLEALILPDGGIRGYSVEELNLDQINAGKALFRLWKATGGQCYERAILTLLGQLERQPRTPSGSYWHKKIYPDQVWLDGLYMFGPFQARCGVEFGRPALVDDVCAQFLAVQSSMKHEATGLYYHAKDERMASTWAHPQTGCSPHVWGRAVGWLSMALVDALDWIPHGHGQRARLVGMLAELLDAEVRAQRASGLWLQVVDEPSRPGNYEETSASAMVAYALYKSARKGYASDGGQAARWRRAADAALEGLIGGRLRWDCAHGTTEKTEESLPKRQPESQTQPRLHLEGICKVAGLGGTPYRDGSFAYYISEPVVADDVKGTGPFMLALCEALFLLKWSAERSRRRGVQRA